MKLEFSHKEASNHRLILIFTGWSCDASLYSEIVVPGWDTAIVYDYSNPEIELEQLSGYSTIWLFAWSLGVAMAQASVPRELITYAVAVNGTPTPVDDSIGIPAAIYQGTAQNLSIGNLLKFRRRMAGSADTFNLLFDKEFTDKDIVSLKHQLIVVNAIASLSDNIKFQWDKAYISNHDLIFPPANMTNAWNQLNVPVEYLDAPHYVDLYNIVRLEIPDTAKIASRFAKAANTYDKQAKAQFRMASILAEKAEEYCGKTGGSVLEIGPGTGVFTREYAKVLKPEHIDFVDICHISPIGMAHSEQYFQADAEIWMEDNDRQYDVILSSCAIQWFANKKRFFENCKRMLRPGGVLALATFMPGTLRELDGVRPTPNLYHDKRQLLDMLIPLFDDIKIDTEKITLTFASSRMMLMHLKETGVAGSAPSTGIRPEAIADIKTLTYNGGFILARKNK